MLYRLEENKENDEDVNGVLFAPVIKEPTLHLAYPEHTGFSRQEWDDKIPTIEQFVKQNNIKLIILDGVGDPLSLDANQRGYSYSVKQKLQTLKHICKTVIFTSDWSYYYKDDPEIRFFCRAFWNPSLKNFHEFYVYADTVYDTSLEKTRPLMCLNRNLEWHRIYLLYLLHNKSWFNSIDYSFINVLGDRLKPKDSDLDKPPFTKQEIQTLRSINLPIHLANEKTWDIRVSYIEGGTSIDLPVYEHCAINLVTETNVLDNIGRMHSEKTAKCIMAYQIPIIIANRGANQWMEDVGLDMFSDYIPWKHWDSIEDHKLRIQNIAEFVDKIMQSPEQILQKHREFHPRLIANKQRFHSQEFADLLIKQLY
tara:strand:- start:569 stop:1669 length:1101 start_codon:yes stop_codon:yes gene_type:complete